jgi:hypothetical protein
MKDFKFYLEYPDNKSKRKATRKNLGNHSGNCLAVFNDVRAHILPDYKNIEAIGAVFYTRNSDCCFTSVGFDYISERCKRISEQQAKKIHPKLFDYLNQ